MRAVVLLLVLGLTLGAQGADGPTHEPKYHLHGNGLTITPTRERITLQFTRGVTITGEDFTLSAPAVTIAIKPTELISTGELKLPKLPAQPEGSVLEDPGKAAREMAREMQLPEPTFSASALQRVEASGGIVAKAQGITLRTPALLSTDGGRSWLADGRTTLTRQAPGEDYQLSAGALLYDTQGQRAVAHDGVQATVRQRGEPEVHLSADRLDFGIQSGELKLGGKLHLVYGDFEVSSSPVSGNLKSQSVSGTQTKISGQGMQASVGQVGINLKQQLVSASGGVNVSDKARGVEISAGSVSANLKQRSLTASGNPTVKYGGSTFTGETITVRQEKGKTVVEVHGEQTAKISPRDVRQAGNGR